jgi:hypothetical protein
MAQQRPVHGVIVMGMGEQQIGHVGGLEVAPAAAAAARGAQPERSRIDERDWRVAFQQHDAAPTEAAVAHGLAGAALQNDINLVAADLHGIYVSLRTARGAGLRRLSLKV